ncbi:Dnah1 [Symbiodinium microadriaticum]|nr:Dnah1 [Symbiodinium microadriaticum]
MASEPDATAGTQAGQDPTDGDPWQSSGAAANSGWWNSWDGAGNGWWQRGQSWGPYPGHSFSSYGYGGWQQRPGWSDYQWQDKQWGEDSAARQKTGQQQSSSKDGEVPAEAAEEATTARRQSVSTMEDDQWLGEGTGSLDEGSSGKTPSAKATGKDFIPEFDGTTPMREYQRRVKLFEISTSIDASYRAQKLMEKLTGSAWLATESIPLESLKHPDGVSRLLDHLWKELEPLEFLRTFQTLADFYKGFRRQKTQEFVAYDMEFRRHGQRLEEINAGLSGVTKAYWFLEKAGLSSELRKQVVAAAGGQYDYAKLRAAVMAIVPQVEKDPESTSHSNHSGRHWRKGPAKVHATVQDEETEELHEVPDDGGEEMQAEALEEELQCLLTQAAKKRAQVERARGFSSGGGGKGRNETPEARAKRIAELKKKMPCSACKAHGRTVYGHWHSDPECPFGKKVPKPGGDSVLAVMEGDATDSDDYGPLPTDIFMTQIVPEEGEYWCASAVSCPDACANEGLLALSDTCCARSVMGQKWAQTHMKHLHQAGLDAYIVDEARPFRFGAGPRISSEYSVVFPMILKGACGIPWIRVSVVDQDVPLLLSKGAMKAIGTCLDLGAAKVKFTALQTDVPLIETDAGLCGFVINDIAEQQVSATGFPPLNMLEGEAEVEVVQHARGVHVTQKGSDDTCEVLARKFLKDENFSYDALQQVVDNLPEFSGRGQRAINGKPRQCQGLMAGAYAHGAFHGIAKSAQRFPQVIRFLNTFMRNALKASGQQARWTSLVVMKNIRMTLHKDNHNAAESETATVSFGTFQQGQLWVEKQSDSDNGEEVVFKKDKNGKRIPGYNVDTWQRPYLLSPKVQHATQRWTGTRWCLSCYTSRAAPQLDDADKVKLRSLGFPVKQVALRLSQRVAIAFVKIARTFNIKMAAKFTAPKRKDEYVEAIRARTGLDASELKKHDMERLKQIWSLVRPKKAQSPLPTGWKKQDVASLKQIYEEHVRPDLDRPNDRHWIRWNRPTLVTEIELWLEEVKETAEPEDMFSETPLCSQCRIPMCVRTNRVTKTDFLGCVRFPACRETLPLTYNGKPTKSVIDELQKNEKNTKEREGMHAWTTTMPKMSRPAPSLPESKGESLDGSWIRTGPQPVEDSQEDEDPKKIYNTNITREELEMVMELRKAKGSADD